MSYAINSVSVVLSAPAMEAVNAAKRLGGVCGITSDVQTKLHDAEKSFRKACEQIVQLNRRLDEMAKRYDKASKENHRSFRYSLRLRMAVTEGVRNMYYEYASNKADEITNLRGQVLHEEHGSSADDDDDEDYSDEFEDDMDAEENVENVEVEMALEEIDETEQITQNSTQNSTQIP